MAKQYKTKSGKTQWMPSIEEAQEMDDDQAGFCLACGNVQDGCEPDAARYECESCGEHKVFGAAEIALMGLVY